MGKVTSTELFGPGTEVEVQEGSIVLSLPGGAGFDGASIQYVDGGDTKSLSLTVYTDPGDEQGISMRLHRTGHGVELRAPGTGPVVIGTDWLSGFNVPAADECPDCGEDMGNHFHRTYHLGGRCVGSIGEGG